MNLTDLSPDPPTQRNFIKFIKFVNFCANLKYPTTIVHFRFSLSMHVTICALVLIDSKMADGEVMRRFICNLSLILSYSGPDNKHYHSDTLKQ